MPTAPKQPLPTHFGTGWISGTLGVVLGAIGLGAVFCFHFPSLLTMPELRAHYPLPIVRGILHLVLVAGFLLGLTSVCLRPSKILGITGMGLVLVAALMGGSRVPIEGELTVGPYLGLDWLLLNLIFWSLLFIPLERFFALRKDQPIFRLGWRTDATYFFLSALLVQFFTLLTLKPAMVLFDWAAIPSLQSAIRAMPAVLQFVLILIFTDLTQYWVHRAFHYFPWLWKFHSIHHSAQAMDWLAGSRLHLVDVVVTRSLSFVPLYILGFEDGPLFAYVVVVSVQATFIHANVRWDFGLLSWLLATPQFHHWHHGADREAIDKNFAVHLPVIDWLFGTFYLPPRTWPSAYGIASGSDVPEGYVQQFVYPFTRSKATTPPAPTVVAEQAPVSQSPSVP